MTGGIEEVGDLNAPNSSNLPCAYTYFGQLVAHDLTSHRLLGANVPPTLRLNTLYGFGASSSPHIYQHSEHPQTGYTFRGVKFFLDKYNLAEPGAPVVYDVPRRSLDRSPEAPARQSAPPNMADARNDQNFIISQLCVALMRRHNQQVELTYNKGEEGAINFNKARLALAHEYQQVILTDYLPRILWGDGRELLIDLAQDAKNFVFFDPENTSCRLSEIFAKAGMRWHTQVRPIYQVRERQGPVHLFLAQNDLRGFVRDNRRKIDWQCLLYEEPNHPKGHRVHQPAKAIDHRIVLSLGDLRFVAPDKKNLIKSNLDQSLKNFESGQAFFEAYIDELKSRPKTTANKPTRHELALVTNYQPMLNKIEEQAHLALGIAPGDPIPLWLFLMLEADVFGNWELQGNQLIPTQVNSRNGLGPLGSRIVAEQILWALRDDPESVLYWRPEQQEFVKTPAYTLVKPMSLAEWLSNVDPKAILPPADLEGLITALPRQVTAPTTTTNAVTVGPRGYKSVYTGDEGNPDFRWASENAAENETDPTRKLKFLNPASKSGERNTILLNGFYFYGTTQGDPGDRKDRIRVYVSRKRIYQHCRIPVTTNDWLDPQKMIRGVIFSFVLEAGQLFFTARGIGPDGAAPEDSSLWLRTDNNLITDVANKTEIDGDGNINPVGGTSFSLEKKRLDLEQNFADNHFVHLKNNGFDGAAHTVDGRQLLRLLKYDETQILDIKDPINLTLHLVGATGQQIADGEWIEADPNNQADAAYLDQTFLSLAIESPTGFALPDGKYLSAAGRPYPPHCYSTNLADWK